MYNRFQKTVGTSKTACRTSYRNVVPVCCPTVVDVWVCTRIAAGFIRSHWNDCVVSLSWRFNFKHVFLLGWWRRAFEVGFFLSSLFWTILEYSGNVCKHIPVIAIRYTWSCIVSYSGLPQTATRYSNSSCNATTPYFWKNAINIFPIWVEGEQRYKDALVNRCLFSLNSGSTDKLSI